MDKEIIERIKTHKLGNKEEALSLYFSLCDCLKEKYGLVDSDYDESSTRRGKEWLDIHHIMEYELDDIARRTQAVKDFESYKLRYGNENVVIALKSADFNDAKKKEEIRKQYPGKSVCFWGIDYTLEELKPYNVKEQLVYANKIEHFLLHYLIASSKGAKIHCGGPNYLWDNCVELDLYGFDADYKNNLKNNKEIFYSIMSSEEVTLLYKKLIDWQDWSIRERATYWTNFKYMVIYLDKKEVSYVDDKEKFFKFLNILDFKLDKEIENKIKTLPFKIKIVTLGNGTKAKVIKEDLYSLDEKTILSFNGIFFKKSFTVPSNIETITEYALHLGLSLEKITIPISVKEIADKAFTAKVGGIGSRRCPNLQKIYYRGTKEMWDVQFSNVDLEGITLVCKKKV